MDKEVIIACDFASPEAVLEFLDRFEEEKPFVKIGMELFYAGGPDIVRRIRERGHKIFLDLKLHDIPNTVRKAMRVLSSLDVDMVNVHAAGGVEMMRAAVEGLREGRGDGTRPLIIAVTQLTSTSREMLNRELLIPGEINDCIAQYARNACEAGLDGVVCSPLEAALVKEACGSGFMAQEGEMLSGFAETTSPADARRIGSDFIVVGRPITAAPDPVAAYRRCKADFCG